MARLPELPARRVLAALRRAGFEEIRRRGSHRFLMHADGRSLIFALHDGERKRRMINNYLELVARVPIFDIAFQPGLDKLPAILDAIEDLGLAADLRG